MSFTKPKIYNLALGALLLSKEVAEVETDTTNEVRILTTHYDIAFESTMQDLDLDSLSKEITLELLATLTDEPFRYVYKYPNNCIYMRRIKSDVPTDDKRTHIAKRTGIYSAQKAIYTDEYQAIIECIPKDVPLAALSPMAGMAIAYRLAFLSAPLIVGKGAKSLRENLEEYYTYAKAEAQRTDSNENFSYESDSQRSEWVAERIS